MVFTMKNAVFWDVTPCGSCKNRVLVERSASIIMETSNRRKLRRNIVSSDLINTILVWNGNSDEIYKKC
jgi:hypothetical protein